MGAHSKKLENKKNSAKNSAKKKDTTADVLYQRMGDKWFAFSVIEDEVYMGALSEEDLNQIKAPHAKQTKSS